jgi:hypothetical protein
MVFMDNLVSESDKLWVRGLHNKISGGHQRTKMDKEHCGQEDDLSCTGCIVEVGREMGHENSRSKNTKSCMLVEITHRTSTKLGAAEEEKVLGVWTSKLLKPGGKLGKNSAKPACVQLSLLRQDTFITVQT